MAPQEPKITLGEVYRLITAVSEDITEIKADVKAQNGSVGDLKTRVAILEDRGSRDTAARATGLSGLVTSVGALLWQLLGK